MPLIIGRNKDLKSYQMLRVLKDVKCFAHNSQTVVLFNMSLDPILIIFQLETATLNCTVESANIHQRLVLCLDQRLVENKA